MKTITFFVYLLELVKMNIFFNFLRSCINMEAGYFGVIYRYLLREMYEVSDKCVRILMYAIL